MVLPISSTGGPVKQQPAYVMTVQLSQNDTEKAPRSDLSPGLGPKWKELRMPEAVVEAPELQKLLQSWP